MSQVKVNKLVTLKEGNQESSFYHIHHLLLSRLSA